jgi:hypothetical protein
MHSGEKKMLAPKNHDDTVFRRWIGARRRGRKKEKKAAERFSLPAVDYSSAMAQSALHALAS